MCPLRNRPVSPDSSVIIDFERIGQLPIILDLFDRRILLSDFVKEELADSGIALPGSELVTLTQDELGLFNDIRLAHRGLGSGECGALALAILRGAVFLANDAPARIACDRRNTPVSGSLGILAHAVDRARCTPEQAVDLMQQMHDEGAWFADQLMDDFRERMLRRQQTER